MPVIKDLTNGELLDEIRNNSEVKDACIEELDKRMTDANAKGKKGFDTPTNPPPIP